VDLVTPPSADFLQPPGYWWVTKPYAQPDTRSSRELGAWGSCRERCWWSREALVP